MIHVRKKENQCKRTRFLYLLLFFILVKLETFFFIVVYVALIKQAVVKRIRSECSTHSNALDDVKVLNTTNPPSLTSSFTIFEKVGK
jgi:hypothetical protein